MPRSFIKNMSFPACTATRWPRQFFFSLSLSFSFSPGEVLDYLRWSQQASARSASCLRSFLLRYYGLSGRKYSISQQTNKMGGVFKFIIRKLKNSKRISVPLKL